MNSDNVARQETAGAFWRIDAGEARGRDAMAMLVPGGIVLRFVEYSEIEAGGSAESTTFVPCGRTEAQRWLLSASSAYAAAPSRLKDSDPFRSLPAVDRDVRP